MSQFPFVLVGPSMDDSKITLRYEYSRAMESVSLSAYVAPLEARNKPRLYLERVSGLLLSGGADLDPSFFGQEPHPRLGEVNPFRDELDLELTKAALEMGLPILAICRGIQVLNVALGGSLVQDIPSQRPSALKHSQKAPRYHTSHSIQVQPGSRLAGIYPQGFGRVNSFHHQAVDELGRDLIATAASPDGIVEAVEGKGEIYVVGVQWHPEDLVEHDAATKQLFQSFADACQNFACRN